MLRRPRDIYDDQQRQSEIRSFSYPSQLRLREWRRCDNTDLLWMSRLLAFFNPEMPKPLPFFNSAQHSLSTENIALNPLGLTPQNSDFRRRKPLAYRTNKSREIKNRSEEAVGRDLRFTTETELLDIFDTQKPSHERRQKELRVLEPVLSADDSDTSSIFLR